jgi:hypothetical protein
MCKDGPLRDTQMLSCAQQSIIHQQILHDAKIQV